MTRNRQFLADTTRLIEVALRHARLPRVERHIPQSHQMARRQVEIRQRSRYGQSFLYQVFGFFIFAATIGNAAKIEMRISDSSQIVKILTDSQPSAHKRLRLLIVTHPVTGATPVIQ